MNLPDLKQLKKVIALCRQQGVKSIKIDNVELTLSEDAPAPQKRRGRPAAKAEVSTAQSEEIPAESLTEDELLFWSSATIPGAEAN